MSDKRLIVAFPQMHAASRRDETLGVLCLDPGVAPRESGVLTPDGLPLDRSTAAAWLAQAQGYAGMFSKPGELLSAYMAGGDDFYSGTAQAIVSELRAMERGDSEDQGHKDRVRAQCVLLLAYVREQGILEVGGLDQGVETAWEDMGRSLGLDEEDSRELAGAATARFMPDLEVSLYDSPDDWLPVLEAFLRLTPAGAALYVDDAGVVDGWRDMGLDFAAAADEALDAVLPGRGSGAWQTLRASGFTLLGRRETDDSALAAERLIVVPVSAHGNGEG